MPLRFSVVFANTCLRSYRRFLSTFSYHFRPRPESRARLDVVEVDDAMMCHSKSENGDIMPCTHGTSRNASERAVRSLFDDLQNDSIAQSRWARTDTKSPSVFINLSVSLSLSQHLVCETANAVRIMRRLLRTPPITHPNGLWVPWVERMGSHGLP